MRLFNRRHSLYCYICKYFDEIKQTTDLIGVYGKERQAKGSAVINKLLQYNNGFTSLNKNYIS